MAHPVMRGLMGWMLWMTAGLAGAVQPVYLVYAVEIPPLIMATPGGATGVVTDITVEAFRRAGFDAKVEIVPWARAYASVQRGQAAALIPTIRSAEREQVFDFPDTPAFRSEMSFFHATAQPLSWTGQIDELRDKRFVKLRAALFAPAFDTAARNGTLQVQETDSFESAIRMVHAGRVDLAAVPKLAGLYLVARERLTGRVAALEPPAYIQPFFIAFARRPGLVDVRQRVDTALAGMWRSGAAQRIVDDYRQRNWQPREDRRVPHR